MTQKPSITTDMIVSGGGLAGMALALMAARPGLSVTVIEPLDPALQQEEGFDGRTTALAYATQQMFAGMGLWEELASSAGAILDIRIVDADSPLWLHYDHREVGENPMGYIVENRHIRRALLSGLARNPHISLLTPASFRDYTADAHGVAVTLADGRTVNGRLLVAADGRRSDVRSASGIEVRESDYRQTAIVCTVRHEKPHRGVAIERFLPAGPFAILPMGRIAGDEGSQHHSSLVWTERRALVPHFLAMDEAAFRAQVAQRFGDYLGVLEVVGSRWSYPLALTTATRYTAPRMALIGDAAHAIHPIAGQGYNLGMRDVAQLAEQVTEAASLGLDIGGAMLLEHYEAARMADSALMIAATDGLNRLFSNDFTPLRLARTLGLAAVQHIPPLKRRFMRHAMGVKKVLG